MRCVLPRRYAHMYARGRDRPAKVAALVNSAMIPASVARRRCASSISASDKARRVPRLSLSSPREPERVADLDMRTTVFAQIDLYAQITTLVLQALVAGKLMKHAGVPVTLALLPITVALGFLGLALVASLATLVDFQAALNAVQRAIMRPARETRSAPRPTSGVNAQVPVDMCRLPGTNRRQHAVPLLRTHPREVSPRHRR